VLAIGPDELTIWKSLTADAWSRTPRQSRARTGIHPVSPADVLLVLRMLRTGKFPRCPAICRGHEGGAACDVPACSPSNAGPHC
jgi:hypothetical protein